MFCRAPGNRPVCPPTAGSRECSRRPWILVVEDDHVRLDDAVMLTWSNSKRWTSSYESIILLPSRLVFFNELVEDEETERPEAREAGVVDTVEDRDEEPGHWSPTHDCPRVLVIHEPGEGLP